MTGDQMIAGRKNFRDIVTFSSADDNTVSETWIVQKSVDIPIDITEGWYRIAEIDAWQLNLLIACSTSYMSYMFSNFLVSAIETVVSDSMIPSVSYNILNQNANGRTVLGLRLKNANNFSAKTRHYICAYLRPESSEKNYLGVTLINFDKLSEFIQIYTEPIPDEDIEGYTNSDLTIGAQTATFAEPRLIF